MATEGPLSFQTETDYYLDDDAPSVWIQVGDIAIYIYRTRAGVCVELCENGNEAEPCLDSVEVNNPKR